MQLKKRVLTAMFGTITSISTDTPVVALTFDDGPDDLETPKLLDLLDLHNIRATFFVLGHRAANHPEVIERMVRSGHAVASHSWSHASMPTLKGSERRREFKKARQALKPYDSGLFRPPYGHLDLPSVLDAIYCGYRIVGWSVTAYDWLDHTDEEILNFIESKLKPGSIILLHDTLYNFERTEYRNREPMFSALEKLIKNINGRFSFVTVPELLKQGRPTKSYRFVSGDENWLKSLITIDDIPAADQDKVA